MRLSIEKARAGGVGITVVRDSSSAAAMGYYAWLAATAGLIGMAITNGVPLMAPWGGREKLLGNQGYAIATPAGSHPPLVFDGAISVMSTGAMHGLAARGEPLPAGVALDAEGRETLDPVAGLAGVLLPAGGHRGYGLALMWEILTGVLAGGDRFAPDVGTPADLSRPQGVALFLLAIDPTVIMPLEAFTARVDTLIDRIHASPRAPGVDRIYVPGERSAGIAETRDETIPLSAAAIEALRGLGAEVGVAW
jgi:LDH2 family malate/lactate/ureidoglycolate dehydrogenase